MSAEHEKHISDFRVLDDHFTELTRAYIRVVLCRDMPDQDNVQKNSEWGILRHEMQKKKRHMPLRELINHLPNTITKLTPCLLMSPLSVAQYLSPDTAIFDLVVFDEASQITTWDAIGAIARGKQVVMVGDPKQLPPTSFFDRAESDLDDEDLEGDLESILDECIGANLPTINLSWHYRSRHESLIAFSNRLEVCLHQDRIPDYCRLQIADLLFHDIGSEDQYHFLIHELRLPKTVLISGLIARCADATAKGHDAFARSLTARQHVT